MIRLVVYTALVLVACAPGHAPQAKEEPDACVAEAVQETCERLHACGVMSLADNCGDVFTAECPEPDGGCPSSDAGSDAGAVDAGSHTCTDFGYPDGYTWCPNISGNGCVDLENGPTNCGMCGVGCATGSYCSHGHCVCQAGANDAACSDPDAG